MRGERSNAPVPLSPARATLDRVIKALSKASEALQAANALAAQLDGIVATTVPIEARLCILRRAHDEAIGKWIAGGCVGKRAMASARS